MYRRIDLSSDMCRRGCSKVSANQKCIGKAIITNSIIMLL